MKRFSWLLILIILIVGAWTAAWFYAATRLKEEANAFFASTSQAPQQINCAQFSVAGYPFRFDITCKDLSITDMDQTLFIPQIKGSILVYRPTHFLMFATGPANITDSFSGSRRQLNWEDLRASLRTNGWQLARLSIEAQNVELLDLLIGETQIAKVEHFQAHLINVDEESAEHATLAQIAALANIENANAPEFNVTDANIELQAKLSAMPDDLRLWTPANIARIWHQTQTGIELVKLEGNDLVSSFAINGSVTTTAQAMMSGNFDFFSNNFAERFDPFLDQTSQQVVFGLKGEDGSNYQSYSLVHGVLLAGNLPILTFGPMR